MAQKFHISPELGARKCTAEEGNCPLGTGTPHFASKQLANEVYEKTLARQNKVFKSIQKPARKNDKKLEFYKGLDNIIGGYEFEDFEKFVNSSEKNYRLLNDYVDYRARNTPDKFDSLHKRSPYVEGSHNPISRSSFNGLRYKIRLYRFTTARMLEALSKSKYNKPHCKEYPKDAKLGELKPTTNYSTNDPEWYITRYNTIGGSDFGYMVMEHFVPREELDQYDRAGIKKMWASKTVPPDVDKITSMIKERENGRDTAAYIGDAWEDRIRDDFSKDHPEFTVYNSKTQYVHPDKSYQRLNVDGVLSDQPKGEPNGILEIKTGGNPDKWRNGIPVNYRAQTLYYLNATGFKYAKLRCVLNDGEVKDYHLNHDDDIYEGSGITTAEFIEKYAIPKFNEVKGQRKKVG